MRDQESDLKGRRSPLTRRRRYALARSDRGMRVRALPMLVLLTSFWMNASATDPQSLPDLPVTDTTTFDALDLANIAPGVADVAVGAGAAVSSFNGNLQVGVPMSTVLPQDGKLPPIAFGLTYNGNNVRQYYVRELTGYNQWLSGRSWVGLGWTGHVGRIFRIARYSENTSTGQWLYSGYAGNFEYPDGSLFSFDPAVRNAQPILDTKYFRDCVNLQSGACQRL